MAFPTTLDTDFGTVIDNTDDVLASHVNELRRAVEGIEAKIGIDTSGVETSLDWKVNNFFVSDGSEQRTLWLYENSNPTGWSIVGISDRVLGVKGGSEDYNASGGTQAGSWTQPSHTLTITEMPSHSHLLGRDPTVGIYARMWGTAAPRTLSPYPTSDTGGDGAHNHGTTYRPYAALGIIVELDLIS